MFSLLSVLMHAKLMHAFYALLWKKCLTRMPNKVSSYRDEGDWFGDWFWQWNDLSLNVRGLAGMLRKALIWKIVYLKQDKGSDHAGHTALWFEALVDIKCQITFLHAVTSGWLLFWVQNTEENGVMKNKISINARGSMPITTPVAQHKAKAWETSRTVSHQCERHIQAS